jgi:endonuclease/exonuclease/phosphatase family metal-dependent hydrolase
MRILSWNVNFRSAECLDAIRDLEPDIVLLQEVKHETKDEIVTRLRHAGCGYCFYSGSPLDDRKRYGNLTASRWPVSAIARGWSPGMPWPQLALRAIAHTPRGDIDTFNVHIPNGSRNGWRKVESFEALTRALSCAEHVARVLGGDFNEPQKILPHGELVTWAQRIDRDGSVRLGRRQSGGAPPGWFTDREGRTDDLRRWNAAVRQIFEGSTQHGLQHIRDIAGGDPRHVPVTHIVHGQPRFFDHLFVSRHLRMIGYRYVDTVRERLRYSDHSAVYADVEFDERNA